MFSSLGNCIINNSLFVSNVGNKGGVCIIDDPSMNISARSSVFFNCTVSNLYDFEIRIKVPAVGIGFFGCFADLEYNCFDSCTSNDGVGIALFLCCAEESSIKHNHFFRTKGYDSALIFESTTGTPITLTQSNITFSNVDYNPLGAFCKCAHKATFVNFAESKESYYHFWVESYSSTSNSNFVKMGEAKKSFIYVNFNESSFISCCFFNYPVSIPFSSGSGSITFKECTADQFYQNIFPRGVIKSTKYSTYPIEEFPQCSNSWKTCRYRYKVKPKIAFLYCINFCFFYMGLL